MIYNINIDRTDAALGTSYPFTPNSKLMLGNSKIPPNMFMCIQVYLDETHVPYARMSTITNTYVCFRDAKGAVIGYWFWNASRERNMSLLLDEYLSDFLYNDAGVITGHISYSYLLPSLFVALLKDTTTYEPSITDFMLLPQCHIVIPQGAARSISINKTPVSSNSTNDVYKRIVNIDEYLDVKMSTTTTDTVVSISVLNRPALPSIINGITNITVGNGESIDCVGKHLLIQHSDASNLRVITTNNNITFSGVLDA